MTNKKFLVLLTVALLACGKSKDSGGDGDYSQKSKRTEAELMLNKIGKANRNYYNDTSAFIVGTTPLSPAKTCCELNAYGKGKCPPDPVLWKDSTWQELSFEIDEAHFFQYQYTGTVNEFTMLAIGDLDCDGKMITYSMHGTLNAGSPTFQLDKPAPNSD
jgi:hypothetical protein